MAQDAFTYGDTAAVSLTCVAGLYSARQSERMVQREVAAAAGYGVADYDLLAELDANAPPLPGDVLLVDCREDDGAAMAALTALDARAAASGHPLIVTTSMEALEPVFGCLDQSRAELLVEPAKGERVLALARALTKIPRMLVREIDEPDRVTLMRLTEQVAQIAAQIDRLSSGEASAFRLQSPGLDFRAPAADESRLIRPLRPPLPDPRLVRQVLRQRQMRAQFFGEELFADPAWDILLDLTAARAEHTRVSVTSLCIASGVPPTTALRWIGQMTEAGLLERVEDESDRRRVFIQLSDKAADAMARYFAEIGKDARSLL